MLVQLFTDAKISTRKVLPGGMMLVKAILTRSGPFKYTAKELGLKDARGTVTVDRTLKTLKHKDTLDSIRGTPVTLGHPKQGDVTSTNVKREQVGNVAGEPEVKDDGMIYADLRINDKKAIKALNEGTVELSVGYTMTLAQDNSGAYITSGPLLVNHVALVKKGRAGNQVRILDQTQSQTADTMEPQVIQQLADTIGRSIREALKGDDTPALDAQVITDAVTAALGPVQEQIKTVVDEQQKAAQKRAADEARVEAEKKAKEFEAAIRAEERQRARVLMGAVDFLTEEQLGTLEDASVKEILVAAVGDQVANAEDKDVSFLEGAMSMLKATKVVKSGTPTYVLPRAQGDQQKTARDEYVQGLENAYKINKQGQSD